MGNNTALNGDDHLGWFARRRNFHLWTLLIPLRWPKNKYRGSNGISLCSICIGYGNILCCSRFLRSLADDCNVLGLLFTGHGETHLSTWLSWFAESPWHYMRGLCSTYHSWYLVVRCEGFTDYALGEKLDEFFSWPRAEYWGHKPCSRDAQTAKQSVIYLANVTDIRLIISQTFKFFRFLMLLFS